ncbi:MAG: TetR/AcrR family transcriptional regulator [Bacteroidota bacterium]|nr:TetR/AcrR family transcriptional regulator [Bacteroidota bacterium]
MEKDQQLIGQAFKLMFSMGIKNLTMDDISRHLGISKKTLYRVVPNKSMLVQMLMENTIESNKKAITAIISKNLNAIDEIREIYRFNIEMFRNMHPSVGFELKKYYPEAWQLLENFKSGFIYGCVRENLKKGIEQKLYRPDINTQILGKLYTTRITEIFNSDVFPPDEFPREVVLKEMFKYHVRGISSAKGLKYLEGEKIDF